MANLHHLLTVLSQRIGRDRGISAQALANRLDCPERQVRQLVTEAREEGHAVCGTPAHGYFIAETAEELEETCAFLRNRSMHSLVLEARLRKIPLADLVGQLKLPT